MTELSIWLQDNSLLDLFNNISFILYTFIILTAGFVVNKLYIAISKRYWLWKNTYQNAKKLLLVNGEGERMYEIKQIDTYS